ncbi:MAG: EamA family transporter [Alphaproteobacteria bacterium]|nr:EamA family transporter [Alphaproteobacteria bacterium]
MKLPHVLLGIVIAFLFASEWVTAKAMMDHVPAFFLNCLRFAILSTLLSPWLCKPIPCSTWMLGTIAICYMVIHFGLVFLGMQLGLDASSTIVVGQAGVPFSALLGFVVFRHKPHYATIAGIILAIIGLCVVFGSPDIRHSPLGFVCVVTGVFSWAVGNILISRLPHIPTAQLLAWFSLFSVLPLAAISWLVDPAWSQLISGMTHYHWLGIIYITCITTLLGDGGWYWLLQRHPTHHIAPFMLLAPLFGALLSILFLDEQITVPMLVGGGMILSGVAFTFLSHRTQTSSLAEG